MILNKQYSRDEWKEQVKKVLGDRKLLRENSKKFKKLLETEALHRFSICILNRQYSPAEYREITQSIIKKMEKTKNFGEYFPVEISPYGYCDVKFETSYAPGRPEIIYCEKCYQQEVY